MTPGLLRAARLAGGLARRAGVGGGTSLPGLIIERTAPDLISHLARRLGQGVVLVSGTNGKTTACRALADLLSAAGLTVIHNRAGSNLIRGISAALVNGEAALGPNSIGLFEVDEATLPQAVQLLSPRLVVLLNLFRDQLDRYGEVDAIVGRWREMVAALPEGATVVLNADDPVVASLGEAAAEAPVYFGVADGTAGLAEPEHAADFTDCLFCGVPFVYDISYFGHLGHYTCPECVRQRPWAQVEATAARGRGLAGTDLTVRVGDRQVDASLPLPGLYNVYNLLAGLAAVYALDLKLADLPATLAAVRPAFGRAERLQAGSRSLVTLLTKNPVGANQVLRTIAQEPGAKTLLLALNDGLADGQDISWIWDVDYEVLRGEVGRVVTTGRRAADMALRLKHAGWFEAGAPQPLVLPDLRQALQTALYETPAGGVLYVLPTYTGMLYLREIMAGMGLTRPFWQEEAQP